MRADEAAITKHLAQARIYVELETECRIEAIPFDDNALSIPSTAPPIAPAY